MGTKAHNYPLDLLNWAGHREGGVKKPFYQNSGRPTGNVIQTPVVKRLRRWIDALIDGDTNAHKATILLGGPGNGKTDAVENAITYLDERLSLGGRLYQEFSSVYACGDQLAPRLVKVDLESLSSNLPKGFPLALCLVQDATEGQPHSSESPAALLVSELGTILKQPSSCIYICCANRGILSEAVTAASKSLNTKNVLELLNEILSSVSAGAKGDCWPLANHGQIAVWPMDVESLAEASLDFSSEPVCKTIFQTALDPTNWPQNCPAGDLCPFCANRRLLSDERRLDALIKLLRYFELGTGKRWSFRDTFSLVAASLVGVDQEFTQNGGKGVMDPCKWAVNHVSNTKQPLRSKLDLLAMLYPHRLFPLLSNFRSGDFYKIRQELKKHRAVELDPLHILMSWLGGRHSPSATEVISTLSGKWSVLLDPAIAKGNIECSKGITVRDVEERFSLSLKDGIQMVSPLLSPLETSVLVELSVADDALGSEALPRGLAMYSKKLQSLLRQFCCRMVKRSIGVQVGFCKDLNHLASYQKAVMEDDGLREFKRQLQLRLFDDKNRFCASLATTFGQPAPRQARDIKIITPQIKVGTVPRQHKTTRPHEPLPFVRIGNHIIPINFELVAALKEVERGLRPACLSRDIFALLDMTRSIVTGQVVRSKEMYDEEIYIELGGCAERIVIEGNKRYLQPIEE